jgi:hypothetical protein
MTPEERAEYREAKREAAEKALDQLLAEEGWATWLRLRRNIHTFSWTNQVLIAIQAMDQALKAAEGDPDAPAAPCDKSPTMVKAAWRWKLDGFHPAKGSRGLLIWVFKSRRRKNGAWTCCGEETREDKCPTCGKQDHFFQVGPVFDASQVRSFETGERPEVPDHTGEPITGDDLGWMLQPLADWAVEQGLASRVDLDAIAEHGEGGSFNTATRELRVCRGASENGRVRVLLHELAHAKGITSRDSDLTYAEAEVAVECVSFMIAATAGLDTSGEAIPYMAGWGGEDARSKVQALAKLIDQTAKDLEAPIVALIEAREEVAA